MASGSALGTLAGGIAGSFLPGGPAVGSQIGGLIGGAFGGPPGKRRKNENYGKLRNLYKEGGAISQQIGQAYGQSGQQLQQGYGQALGALAGVGQAEKMRILQGQQQQIAELNQNMTNRGLYNTSIGAGAGQGFQNVRQNTQMALGNLASQLGGLRANLYTQRGQALAGNTLGQLGAQYQRQGAFAGVLSGPLAAPSGSGGWGRQVAGYGQGPSAEGLGALGQLGGKIGKLFGGSEE